MGTLTVRSPQIRALLAITFLFPIVLCAAFFPTPAGDLREHINLGLGFHFYAVSQPPLQTWLAGAVALTGARDAWLFVAVAQALNFIGLLYLALIAKRFLGPGTVIPLLILFCGSLYSSPATPSMALNADQIQVPLWAGIVFHGLMALRDDRWRDWLACGVLIGTSFIAKYTVVMLVAAIVVSLALIPTYRRVFANPRFYLAGLASLPIIALHAVPELSRGYSLEYAAEQFWLDASFAKRADSLWQLVRSYLLYGSPILIGLAELARRRAITFQGALDAPARLIVFVVGLCVAALVLMIVLFGLNYSTRHAYPLFGLSLLAVLALLRLDPQSMRPLANLMLAIWGCILVGALIYSQVAINRSLREPAPAAAEALRALWDQRFSCGPAYIVGDDRSSRALAINFGRPVVGIPFDDTGRADWLDKDRMVRLGAIVAATPDVAERPEWSAWFKDRNALTRPYRRTFRSEQHTYVYSFIAPQSCPAAAK
jgi:hypothetical protein